MHTKFEFDFLHYWFRFFVVSWIMYKYVHKSFNMASTYDSQLIPKEKMKCLLEKYS